MEKIVVRLVSMEINNIKNVLHGSLEFSNGHKGSIMGIYGENGSGKTVVVDCMVLLKCLLTSKNIPANFYQYIYCQSDSANVKYCFDIKAEAGHFYAEYEVTLLKNELSGFCISKEQLNMKPWEKGKRTKLTPLFIYQKGTCELFRPLKYYHYFEQNIESIVALSIAQQSTEGFDEDKQLSEVSSFLFSKKAQEVFAKAEEDAEKIYCISHLLQYYGERHLSVIENMQYGLMALNLKRLPLNIDWPDELKPKAAGIMLHLTDVNVVAREIYPYVKNTIEQINTVLMSLVPETRLELYHTFEKLMENGKEGIQFEVITVRNEARIPLLYESAGIKKLISICSNLVACYNRESYCLVVDELDSGIYEYLLGECLEVMQNKAKGQLIFTSHNLRALEVLDKEFLVYTTVNPQNRYIKSAYIKNTQNTRLSYLRSIKLGGQKEKLYHDTNIYDIELAMRRAGRVKYDDEKNHSSSGGRTK